ncbi:hypothetical protein CPT_Phriendly_006 [Vibrio phage Phriendly]|nr:hypothetical protein CPT_Phriendly_006 [Vibrio phage Phriendly]
MNIQEMKLMAANTKINKMLNKQSFFSICAISETLDVMGMRAQCGESYKALKALHCIEYDDMPRELVKALPELISNVFSGSDEPQRTFTVNIKSLN